MGKIIANTFNNYFVNVGSSLAIIDSKLNWAAPILYMKSKISKSIGILLKIRKFLQNNTMRNAQHTYLDPVIKIQKKISEQ